MCFYYQKLTSTIQTKQDKSDMATLTERPIYFTNSKGHKKERFSPQVPGEVKFYSCGPTVYGPIHVGNLRAALTADLIFRFFKKMGFKVTYVRNYTDIDDRIIGQMIQEKLTLEAITQKYITSVEQDYALALMEEPTHKTKVTDHLPEIVTMIEQILQHQHGYVTDEGEVFFSIDSFKSYGSLSNKPLDELQAGQRVEVNPKKRNPLDFSLWKPAKPGEPSWSSPWAKGRPGWHIECSAMACKWLGAQMDVHHGGVDLIFPHHENEIAQSEAATGAQPYAKVWLHNAFLNLSGEKMSKSLGNIVSARDFLAHYGGEVARMVMLSVHYRSSLDFNGEAVDHAVTALARIYEAKEKAEKLREKKISLPDPMAEQVWGGFLMECERTRSAIRDHYCNDLNTAGALSEFFTLTREWNRCLAHPNAENTSGAILAANEWIKVLEEEIGSVIGVGRARSETVLKKLEEIKVLRAENEGQKVMTEAEVSLLLEERKQVRLEKNFKRSDEIRDLLLAAGIEIKDSPQGTTWKRR